MARLIIVLIAVALLWNWFQSRPSTPTAPKSKSPASGNASTTLMVACAHCGLHVPQHEALTGRDGRSYCCEAHRAAAERA